MRILHCITSLDPANGGTVEGIKRLGQALVRQGHFVEVVSTDQARAPWVAEFPLPVHALGPGNNRYGYSRQLVPWLRSNVGRFDMVVVDGIWQYHSLAVWRALRKTEKPYVVFPHGMLDPWFKRTYPMKHFKKWLYWPWAEYRVLRDATRVIFTSEEERALASESFWLYRVKEAVVNYGTADPPPLSHEQREKLLNRFPQLRGKRVFLFLGRIHPKKGCDILLESFGSLLPAQTDLHLLMAGPGPERLRKSLEKLAARVGIAEHVTWAGELHGADKWGAFRAAEAFVLPSHQENFGIAVAEALACGVPVLITDKVNIWQEIAADRAGIVASDTLAGVEGLLRRWLAIPEGERAAMATRARDSFLRRFEISRTARAFLKLIQSELNGTGHG